MNLRQKVKKAKKDLIIAEEKYHGTSTWDIIEGFRVKSPLKKIIDYKRKPNRMIHFNEEHKVDWTKLTYIKLHADYGELIKMVSPNGQPFSKEQLTDFINESINEIYKYALKVMERSKDGNEYTDYVFLVSESRTKQKIFQSKKFYRQYHGDDKLHLQNEI